MRALPGWPATLTEGDIVLRPHRRTDAKSWREVRLANQAWLEPWEATLATPWERRHEPQDFVAMLRAQRKMMKLGNIMPFALLYRGRFAGQLTVGGIVRGAFYSAVIGYWLDRAVAGRGVMPTAVAMACDFCFYSAGLHRVEINVRPENTASRRVVEKLGFREEGFHPRFLHIDGDWRDHIGYALTAEDVTPQGLLARWRETRKS